MYVEEIMRQLDLESEEDKKDLKKVLFWYFTGSGETFILVGYDMFHM